MYTSGKAFLSCLTISANKKVLKGYLPIGPYGYRDGNLILTALTTGRVPLINATKSLGFVLAQVVLTLAWASANFQPCGHVSKNDLYRVC